MSSNQGNATRLSKIAAHLSLQSNHLHPCTRIPSQSLCSNSTSKGQFITTKDEGPEKGERFLSNLLDISPNESWSKETMRIYNELCKQVDESNGLWEICEWYAYTGGKYRSFYSSIDQNGKRLFAFSVILNKTEKHMKGVCQFGPCTMGPTGFVHGGAIATMLDVFTGGLSGRFGYQTLTANLTVDFKLPVPVESTVLIESKIESIEGRKMYISGEIKSSDGLQLYATARTLFIVVDLSNKSKVQDKEVPKKDERFLSKLQYINPNESWSKETIRLYNELRKQVDESNELWVVPEFPRHIDEYRRFHRTVDQNGKRLFEYYDILNKAEKHIKGFCQFGPWTMGPRGYVHGGAIATMLDVFTGGIPNRIGYRSATANLSVDYKLPLPVGSTVLMEAKIESIQGRKIYINGEMKSSDGLQVYATVKTLMCTARNPNQRNA